MTVFLDIIGSLFIRASMVAVMLTLTVNMNNALYERSQHANAKAHLSVLQTVIQTELAQVGYNNTAGHNFCYVYQQDVRFHGDVDKDNTTERIRYFAVQDAGTGYWKLYRTEDYGTPQEIGRNFTSVTFQYYKANGSITWDPSLVKVVRMNLVMQVQGVSEGFTTATKEFKIYPANI